MGTQAYLQGASLAVWEVALVARSYKNVELRTAGGRGRRGCDAMKLLDEHLAPSIVQRMSEAGLGVVAPRDWHAGTYLQLPDRTILRAAH